MHNKLVVCSWHFAERGVLMFFPISLMLFRFCFGFLPSGGSSTPVQVLSILRKRGVLFPSVEAVESSNAAMCVDGINVTTMITFKRAAGNMPPIDVLPGSRNVQYVTMFSKYGAIASCSQTHASSFRSSYGADFVAIVTDSLYHAPAKIVTDTFGSDSTTCSPMRCG
jgi:hypothetical protein